MVKSKAKMGDTAVSQVRKYTFDSTAKENEYLQLTGTPRYFDPERKTPLSLHQIVFFDECH
jgi:hypothetical protein